MCVFLPGEIDFSEVGMNSILLLLKPGHVATHHLRDLNSNSTSRINKQFTSPHLKNYSTLTNSQNWPFYVPLEAGPVY
jgi:hypothetical protein